MEERCAPKFLMTSKSVQLRLEIGCIHAHLNEDFDDEERVVYEWKKVTELQNVVTLRSAAERVREER